jgi:shikimate kinase
LSVHNNLKRAPGVYLAGFMGSGKTTVARILADRLGWDFIDLDAEIEAVEHTTISQLFETRGELEFRRLETETLRNVMRRIERGMPSVIALGGGSFVQPHNARLLEGHGISIWLDCSFETITERMRETEAAARPLARDPNAFRQLFEERRAAYSCATYRVDADCDVEHAVEQILALPIWK